MKTTGTWFYLTLFSMVAALMVAGCAPPTQELESLVTARNSYAQAQNSVDVQKHATLELKKAQEHLSKAEALAERGAPRDEIEHHAYLTRQQARIALETGEFKAGQQKIESASEERNRVLLQAREAEVQRATQRAQEYESRAQQYEERAREAERAKLSAEEKSQRLQQQISELEGRETPRGIVLTLGDVLFDLNKAELRSGGMATVEKVATFLKEYSERTVMIEGFTDSTGAEDYNQKLSERRANSVRDALVARGISPERIATRGYGERFPVATNETAAGRQQNRRVELIISDDEGAIPERTR